MTQTPTPGSTDNPTPTEKPSVTDKPTESDKPTETEKPSETDKPSEPTSKPTEPTPTPDVGDGAVVQNKEYKYRVFVWDNDGAITEFGLVKLLDDGNLKIELPATKLLDVENRTYIKVINENDKAPVKNITVNVTDNTGASTSDITNSEGIAVVPVTDTDITDGNGNAQVKDDKGNLYNVNVATETKGNIEGAAVKITGDKITATLPNDVVIDYADRTTVTVTDRDTKPVLGINVNVRDTKNNDRTETTDENGKVVVPPLSENYTDKDGNAVVNGYTVNVSDTKTKIENAFVTIKDGKISVKLPDGHELTTSNQTTVTVTDQDDKPVKGMSVKVTDKNSKTAGKDTDANGKITVPVKTSGGGSSSGGSSGGGGGSSSYSSVNVKITDKDGKNVTGFSKSVDSKGNVTITLPSEKMLENDYYTITVTDRNSKVKADIKVILRDKNKSEATGITNKDGMLILPVSEHKAYIVGYDDGTFRPDSDMTRAEAAAIFARLIAEKKGESISGKSSFSDISSDEWYYSYIGYLAKYNIVKGYEDKTFRPNSPVTRAEFVSMTVRFYGLFNDVKYPANTTKYSDIDGSHWAVKDISFGKSIGWLNGYADGTFKPDNNITRAEVVTVVNHATEREADKEYINKNLSVLNKFTDLKNNSHWAYYDILESANTHKAADSSDGEVWVK